MRFYIRANFRLRKFSIGDKFFIHDLEANYFFPFLVETNNFFLKKLETNYFFRKFTRPPLTYQMTGPLLIHYYKVEV